MSEEEEIKVSPKSKKIFINHLDTFHSFHVAEFLSKCVSGATISEEEDEEEEEVKDGVKEGQFEIVGTLLNSDFNVEKLDFVKKIITLEKREDLFAALDDVNVIIYNVLDDEYQLDECEWLSKIIFDEAEKVSIQKQFIMLSSVMTWAKTKQIEPEEGVELPFTEEDYRRRKAHPNFQGHLALEKNITRRGNSKKEKLITYVVAAGLTYGCGENVFHNFFKEAWENSPELQVFDNGQNVLPTIHIKDVAGVCHNIIDARPKTRYILATDDSKNTLEEIIKAISKSLSTGKVKYITKEEVLTNEDVKQNDYDQLLLNLQIDPVFVKETMKMKWVSETGMIDSINKIVKEFKQIRNLIPFRVCVLGPPTIGKSLVSSEIAKDFRIHMVNLKDVIEKTIAELGRSAARIDQPAGDEEEEGDEGAADKAAEDAELLERVQESKEENDGRIGPEIINKFLKMKLLSKSCRNQGFVLDNYPKTKDEAISLFNIGEDDDEEEEGEEETEESDEEKVEYNKNLLPTHVFVLEADNDFLKKRIMSLPEELVTGTHNTEEGFLRRLDEYRRNNNVEDSVLNYFEDNKVNITHIDVMKEEFKTAPKVIHEIKTVLGKPRNYYPTPAQIAASRRKLEEVEECRQSQMSEEKRRRKEEEQSMREERKAEWTEKLVNLKQAEEQYLDEQSLPLSKYLLRHVMPVLTEGLIDCVKNRPENAVDHLAEYLFRHNPIYD